MHDRTHKRPVAFALALTVAVVALISSCPAAQQAEDSLQPVVTQPQGTTQEPLNWNAYQYFVNGLMYEGFEDLPSAAESYSKALERFPDSHEIAVTYAGVLLQLREPQRAIAVLKDVHPEDEIVLSMRAEGYRQLADNDAAKAEFSKLVQIDSFNTQAYLFLAAFYQQSGNVDSTIWAYRNLERVRPDNYQIPNELGRLLAMQGNMDEARAAFRRSLAITGPPENMPALANLVAVFQRQNQMDSIIAAFEEGILYDPNNISLRNELVRLYVQRDSLGRALPHMRALVAAKPDDLENRRRLGLLYMGLDSLTIADSIITGVINSGSANYFDHYYLGQIAAVSENYPRAASEFRQAIALDSTQADAWLNLAAVFGSQNQRDSAIALYQQGIEHMPDESSAVRMSFALGASQEQAGQVDSAVATFERILEHQPNNDQALNYLGYALADRGIRLDYAQELIARALKNQPRNAAYLDSYGWVFYRQGKYDSALVYLKSASDLDNDTVILDHLGDVYQALGDKAKAREIWESIIAREPENQSVREKLGR